MKTINSFADLQALDGHAEDRTLEIKAQAIRTEDLVELIQAGANGVVPLLRIIIGAEEDHGRFRVANLRPIKFPIKLGSADIGSFDQYKQNVVSVISSTTSAYVEPFFEIREIEIPGGSVIVIEVPQSSRRPHQNTRKGNFPIRADGRVRSMTSEEIRSLMCSSQIAEVATEDQPVFAPPWWSPTGQMPVITDRDLKPGALISRIDEETGDDRHVRIRGEAHLVMKLGPDMMGKTWDTVDILNKMQSCGEWVFPLGATAGARAYSRNDHGGVVWAINADERSSTTNATQIDRYGEVSSIDTALLDPRMCAAEVGTKTYNLLFTPAIEDACNEALFGFANFLIKVLSLPLPLRGSVGVINVDNYRLQGDRSARIDQSTIFDGFVIKSTDIEPIDLLLPFYNKLWRAANRTRN